MNPDLVEHFYDWLENTVHPSEQETVERQIRRLLELWPELGNGNHAWGALRRTAEAQGFER